MKVHPGGNMIQLSGGRPLAEKKLGGLTIDPMTENWTS
jgi:hypothetical protein